MRLNILLDIIMSKHMTRLLYISRFYLLREKKNRLECTCTLYIVHARPSIDQKYKIMLYVIHKFF